MPGALKNEGHAMPDPARGAWPAGGGHAAALLPGPFRPPPRTARHETGPSTTFGRHPPTMASQAKIKPQVDGLRFSQNTGYGRWVGVKRSKWAGFVAATSQADDRGHTEVSRAPV